MLPFRSDSATGRQISPVELVLIPTDVTEDMDMPRINKILSFNCLTAIAQIHFSYPGSEMVQISSCCVAAKT